VPADTVLSIRACDVGSTLQDAVDETVRLTAARMRKRSTVTTRFERGADGRTASLVEEHVGTAEPGESGSDYKRAGQAGFRKENK
jgi:hypothetical protein